MSLKKIREILQVVVIITLGIMLVDVSNELRETKRYVSDLEVAVDTIQDITVDHDYVIKEILKGGN